MKRRQRQIYFASAQDDTDFKHQIIKDILYQIDYQTALRHNVVTIREETMVEEMKKLPTNILLSWYLAYIYIRRELMFAGYELHGLKVLDKPLDAINEMINKDPDFDVRQYIF